MPRPSLSMRDVPDDTVDDPPEDPSKFTGSLPGIEGAFASWLQELLSSERAALVGKLQQIVERQVSDHHHALAEALNTQGEQGDRVPPMHLVLSDPRGTNPDAPIAVNLLATETSYVTDCPSEWSKGCENVPAGTIAQAGVFDKQKTFPSLDPLTAVCFTTVESGGTGSNHGEQHRYKSDYLASFVTKDTSRNLVGPVCLPAVNSGYFELVVSILILANVAVTALEVQYIGCQVGQSINHPDCPQTGNFDRAMDRTFNLAGLFFSSCFTIEFVLRSLHYGKKAIRIGWMWFDFFCLVFGIMDACSRLVSADILMLNPTTIRVTRIIRMLRIAKFFRSKEATQTLFLLMKSILASRHTLIWFVLILFITITCIGLLMNQLLYSYLSDPNVDLEARQAVYEYFGTYTRMIITMFEITLGNWPTPTRVLMVHVNQWWGIFVVLYRCVFCFSLVNTTLAVFINETSRVAADDQVQMMHKLRRDQHTERTMLELFKEIDESGDGLMSFEELQLAAQDKVMTDIMEIHGFDIQDVEELFRLMDDGSGKVSQDKLVQGVMRYSGHAKGSRQLSLLRLVTCIDAKVSELSAEVKQQRQRGLRTSTLSAVQNGRLA